MPETDREVFMSETLWPTELVIQGTCYMMMARGYWHCAHYWCKVFRVVNGISGIWKQDELHNAGVAQLLSADPASIGGPSPHKLDFLYS